MGLFSRADKSQKNFSLEEVLTYLPGHWAGPGKIYTPAGVQNYRVELTLDADTATTPVSRLLTGKLVSYFESGTILDTPVQLKLEKEIWFLVYTQTNVHGQGKLAAGKLGFLQKDPPSKSGGQTEEIWNFLSADHLFIENFIIGPTGEREPFLKIMLQKT